MGVAGPGLHSAAKPDLTVNHRIRQVAIGLEFSHGLDFTVDGVAAAGGVGRASVVRRYATKRGSCSKATCAW
ncbi:hypothetical protein [Nonomuraea basaltis]|uniref:hypothetical protein n=1 Tax=Nonomuraea basaltis TaxID=2495887 RepID=UPI00197FE602|nr:hypothetical protein [Nonomuraea basaltis]